MGLGVTNLVSFGRDAVTFESFSPDPNAQPDELGTLPMLQADNTVPGCRHRPLRAEVASGGGGVVRAQYPVPGIGIATDWWQTTCPPHPAAVAAKASDVISIGGLQFRILGDARPFLENGRVVKVTFLSERQTPIQ